MFPYFHLLSLSLVGGSVQALAFKSLVTGCTTTLRMFVSDERSDPSRITEPRIEEVKVVLRTVRSLMESEQRQLALQLYPDLVDCVIIASPAVRLLLRDVLASFNDCLASK
eukprot:m.209727 g.209727  ORF g.209727 m.209727 type:complete len:111 (+) comp53951_c0_seq3:4436-4768(+)